MAADLVRQAAPAPHGACDAAGAVLCRKVGSAPTPSHQVFATPSRHLPLVHTSPLVCTFPEGQRAAQGHILTPLSLSLTRSGVQLGGVTDPRA